MLQALGLKDCYIKSDNPAVREACLFVKASGLTDCWIESDIASVISLSVSELVPPWKVAAILFDIRLFAGELKKFAWTRRKGNQVGQCGRYFGENQSKASRGFSTLKPL